MIVVVIFAAVAALGFFFFHKQKAAESEYSRRQAQRESAPKVQITSAPASSSTQRPFNPNANASDAAAFARSLQMSPEERARRARGL